MNRKLTRKRIGVVIAATVAWLALVVFMSGDERDPLMGIGSGKYVLFLMIIAVSFSLGLCSFMIGRLRLGGGFLLLVAVFGGLPPVRSDSPVELRLFNNTSQTAQVILRRDEPGREKHLAVKPGSIQHYRVLGYGENHERLTVEINGKKIESEIYKLRNTTILISPNSITLEPFKPVVSTPSPPFNP